MKLMNLMKSGFGVAVMAIGLILGGCDNKQSMHWGHDHNHAALAAPKPPADTRQILRIKAGLGAAWKDKAGNTWVDETPYVTGGEVVTRDPAMAVAGTDDPDLYRSERYGAADFSYTIPVPNGKYTVKLYMAEMYPEGVSGPGGRIFTYEVQGQVVKDLDITKKVGALQKANIEVINNVEVKDGKLVIKFVNTGTQNPCVSGIEIVPV
jgi:hypothetical protein